MTDELLTIDDIAALYKCKPRTARDVIVKQPWFPHNLVLRQQRK